MRDGRTGRHRLVCGNRLARILRDLRFLGRARKANRVNELSDFRGYLAARFEHGGVNHRSRASVDGAFSQFLVSSPKGGVRMVIAL